jgi:hypothetical protein
MIKQFIVLLLVCSISTPLALAGTFRDDFGDEKQSEANWITLNADWEVKDGKCIFSCPTNNSAPGALLLDFQTEDKMEIEVSVTDYGTGVWQNFYIVFAYLEDEGEMYRAGGFIGGGEWRLHVVRGGSAIQLQTVGAPVAAGQEYTMKIAIDGDTAVFYADGEEVLQYTFPEGMPVGKIGFGQSQADGEFDNFKVEASGIKMAVGTAESLTTTWGEIKSS